MRGADSGRDVEAGRAPAVFISYSHDNDTHRERALRLAEVLRKFGVASQIDRYVETRPPSSWPTWMHDQVQAADFVLVVCSETYQRRLLGREAPGVGLGARWEGALITQEVYADAASRFMPVMFDAADQAYIPYFLRGTSHYVIDVDTGAGLESLLRRLHDEPEIRPAEIGSRPTFSQRSADDESLVSYVNAQIGPGAGDPRTLSQPASSMHGFLQPGFRALHLASIGEPLETVLLSLRESLTVFAEMMSEQVGTRCRATLLELGASSTGSPNVGVLSQVNVAPRATSSGPTSVPQRLAKPTPIDEYLDLSKLFTEPERTVLIDPDTTVAGGILRRHYKTEKYRATIVWPLQDPAGIDQTKYRTFLGFLCLDAMIPDAFDANRDVALGIVYSQLLYAILDALFRRIGGL